jgi:hypothetical protein
MAPGVQQVEAKSRQLDVQQAGIVLIKHVGIPSDDLVGYGQELVDREPIELAAKRGNYVLTVAIRALPARLVEDPLA